ncbi:Protein polybromo-1 [Golovinomyces cichoracearum]|uniref:Protein polybromo-1 n=1 Tax=Golovinomyces cichoracearum TaxID=62708 RepID=A0A420IDX4_9PEZI|nr:Protein polybromo-1 [Golovinomyces cichoracearum]
MSKRINGGAAGMELDERAVKRRKLPVDNHDETAESTTQHGLELLEIIKKITDKNGRLVAVNFLQLPNKRLLPEYYQIIKMPIALDTIEAKLRRREFPNLTSLEGYFKRMVSNAKDFNEKESTIHEDSERLRKTVCSYMTKHNPAYKTVPGFAASPASILTEESSQVNKEFPFNQFPMDHQSKILIRAPKNIQTAKSSTTPTLSELQYSGVSFEGLSFQQAQEKIVEDIIAEKEWEEDDFGAFEPFINLPSRKEYRDYYDVITHPLALRDLQRAVKGMRTKTPGVSEFKTWSNFEEEASFIWKNAFQYNEDNSDIFKLAIDLQEFFNKLLQKAKSFVPEPVSTKIKLRMPEPTKITLKINRKSSPPESPFPQQTPPLALVNQSKATGITSHHSTNAITDSPHVSRPENVRNIPELFQTPKPSASSIKNEEISQNPASVIPLNKLPPVNGSNVSATPTFVHPPTTTLSRNHSDSGYIKSFIHQPQPGLNTNSKFRLPGNAASDAMITNLSIATHPGLNITRHFNMDLPPSATLTQQSVTINLPATHYYLQIKPSIASAMMQRQHKLFVTAGSTRLHAMPTIPGHPVEPKSPLFEARLHPGVNRIEIEIVAAFPINVITASEVEMEKFCIFVNLMRA